MTDQGGRLERESLHREHQAAVPRCSDLTLSLDQAAAGYRAMDERRAIKVLLQD